MAKGTKYSQQFKEDAVYVFCRFFAHPFQVLDVIGFELV